MDNDELLAVLRGDIARVNQRIDEAKANLGGRIGEVKTDLGWRIDKTNQRIGDTRSALVWRIDDVKSHLVRRIDGATPGVGSFGQFKLQDASFVVLALAATTALVGTFVLQVLAVL